MTLMLPLMVLFLLFRCKLQDIWSGYVFWEGGFPFLLQKFSVRIVLIACMLLFTFGNFTHVQHWGGKRLFYMACIAELPG